MTQAEFAYRIRSWTLVPASGGKFEVTVNGEVVFSKKTLGRHAEPGEIAALLRARLPPHANGADAGA